jgi:hypothetical protein
MRAASVGDGRVSSISSRFRRADTPAMLRARPARNAAVPAGIDRGRRIGRLAADRCLRPAR